MNVREIHSRKPQSYRTRVSDEFRKSKGLILVTSDVSARGVDYPDVTLVIQVNHFTPFSAFISFTTVICHMDSPGSEGNVLCRTVNLGY